MRWLCAVAVFVMLFGCPDATLKAVDPTWGKQQCQHCAMLVSEKMSAAQVVVEGGKRYFFDDLGCMVSWEERERPKVVARWVRGLRGKGWVDPQTVHFSGGHPTPMDFGYWADTEGMSFEQVRAAVRGKAERTPGESP